MNNPEIIIFVIAAAFLLPVVTLAAKDIHRRRRRKRVSAFFDSEILKKAKEEGIFQKSGKVIPIPREPGKSMKFRQYKGFKIVERKDLPNNGHITFVESDSDPDIAKALMDGIDNQRDKIDRDIIDAMAYSGYVHVKDPGYGVVKVDVNA